ncbi:MAG: site-2 protease family protein [Thermoprotei archaeon]|nr:site-2 protease family protein [Thermoprotei archaeon]
MDPLVLAAAAFTALWVLAWLVFRGRRGKLQVYPLLLIVRFGVALEPYGGGLLPRLLNWVGWFSIALFLVAMVSFYVLIVELIRARYFSGETLPGGAQPGLVPLIPGVTVPLDANLAFILIAVGLAIVVHEAAHALIARASGVKVKDFGLLLLAFIPGAFVEPDEGSLKKAPLASRLKIYSGGVMGNIVLAFIAFLVLTALASTVSTYVVIQEVLENSPASEAGLKPGMVIVEVEGSPVKTIGEFTEALEKLGVKDKGRSVTFNVKVAYEGGELELKVFKPEGRDKIGVTVAQAFEFGLGGSLIIPLLMALFMINLALALINAAPIFVPTPMGALVTDGGHFLGDLIARLGGEDAKRFVTPLVGVVTLAMVISLLTIFPIRVVP